MTGRIFVSPEEVPELKSVFENDPSLGHLIIKELSQNNSEDVIFIDAETGREYKGKEIHDKVLNIAHALVDEFHLEKGNVVCVSYDHSVETILVCLGVVCAGGAFVCAYSKDPYPELLYLARKVEPRMLLCHAKNLDWAERLERDLGHSVIGIAMDDDGSHKSPPSRHFNYLVNYDHRQSKSLGTLPPACDNPETDIAMIMMSSGTTGKPKAVSASQLNCIGDVRYILNKTVKGIRFACSASLDYISGRLIVFGAVFGGYSAIIIKNSEPKFYLEAIERHKINLVYIGAAAFYKIITHPDADKHDLSSLRVVFPMGSKITYLEELREFFKKHPNLKAVRQGFGTSETSGVAMNSITPDDYLRDCENCGHLIAGAKAKIVDTETGQLLGPNQRGMLHIKSYSTFPGYYDVSVLKTADGGEGAGSPFVRDSTVFDEDGFYITGDIAYFNDKEELYIIGRQKELMSCRGAKKVLPQELEEVVEQHPAVDWVCVLGMPNTKLPGIHCPRAFIKVRPECYNEGLDGLMQKTNRQKGFDANENEETLEFKGDHKLCQLSKEKRHVISMDLMDYVNCVVGWEKQLTGGIVLLDSIPTLRETGKVDKTFLRSLDIDQIEIYGDQSV